MGCKVVSAMTWHRQLGRLRVGTAVLGRVSAYRCDKRTGHT